MRRYEMKFCQVTTLQKTKQYGPCLHYNPNIVQLLQIVSAENKKPEQNAPAFVVEKYQKRYSKSICYFV